MGAEFRNITFAGERAAALDTVLRHQTYQVDDRRIRALNTAGERRAAIAFCTSYTPGQSDDAFARYDRSLSALIAINQTAFRTAVERGLRSGGLPRSTARTRT